MTEDGPAQPLDLSDDSLRALLTTSRWPEVVATAGGGASTCGGHLLELAQGFQSYYNDHGSWSMRRRCAMPARWRWRYDRCSPTAWGCLA